MRIPRDVSGKDLIKKLQVFGYVVTRQSGSHIRVTSNVREEHHITIPNHDHLRVGTLNSIISEIAIKQSVPKETIIKLLFD